MERHDAVFERVADVLLALVLGVFLVGDVIELLHRVDYWRLARVTVEVLLVVFYARRVKRIVQGSNRSDNRSVRGGRAL